MIVLGIAVHATALDYRSGVIAVTTVDVVGTGAGEQCIAVVLTPDVVLSAVPPDVVMVVTSSDFVGVFPSSDLVRSPRPLAQGVDMRAVDRRAQSHPHQQTDRRADCDQANAEPGE